MTNEILPITEELLSSYRLSPDFNNYKDPVLRSNHLPIIGFDNEEILRNHNTVPALNELPQTIVGYTGNHDAKYSNSIIIGVGYIIIAIIFYYEFIF
ncbi:hypothetical protein BN7_230 [Wickerhamomyces ciferrii]|uniref:Uncharacterized protein n=1 Tax=Wickerhamomyces ciferrii (strain ATCC 14091 / BCRC 22168 / CBS 111 / JCM 3599 / NBRC 0793 / NRRL Y-1031 F-60-10) TaxID=1206466 RepID=K0KCS7_WICCF|nr:uncharacterized protein BN7_230 [Wickerhamomyces ciferrii]CCH40696.1 hypothetical protein BN7_230 [Wickerhamomyces ciferrii]